MSGERRMTSLTRTPSSILPTASRSAAVSSSVEPRSRKRALPNAARATSRRERYPALRDARTNANADEPAMSVRSRSKNAAGCIDPHRSDRLRRDGLHGLADDQLHPQPLLVHLPRDRQERRDDVRVEVRAGG